MTARTDEDMKAIRLYVKQRGGRNSRPPDQFSIKFNRIFSVRGRKNDRTERFTRHE